MMEGWKQIRLGDVCDINKDSIKKDFPFDEITYLDISSVGTNEADFSNVLSLKKAPSRAKRIPSKSDTIIATVRPGNRNFTFLKSFPPNTVVSTGFAVLSPIVSKINYRYLYYIISEPSFTGYLVSIEQGANYPAVSARDIANAKINLPPLPTQQKIAAILSAYDDLIENNLKRIKLLEEQAQLTYEEWFSVEGIPKGWTETVLGELIDFHIGGGWGQENIEEDFPDPAYVIRGTDMDGIPVGSIDKVPFRWHKQSNLKSRKLMHGDIIFEVSGGSSNEGVAKSLLITKGLLSQFDGDVMCASFCKLMRPKTVDYSYVLIHFLKFLRASKNTEIFEKRSASNIVNYNWEAFLKYQKIKIPNADILNEFNQIIKPMITTVYNLGQQNTKLKEARDILLPRLMTGMIDVDKLDVPIKQNENAL